MWKRRKALAGEIRTYWKKYKDVPLAERWYRILSDDRASAEEWLAVANKIVLPGHPDDSYDPFDLAMASRPLRCGERPILRGDVLRDKRRPSVAQLLAQRVEELAVRKERADDWPQTPLERACEMAMILAQWDPEASLPILRRQTQRCRDAIVTRGRKFGEFRENAKYIARFTIPCARLATDRHWMNMRLGFAVRRPRHSKVK